MAQPSPLCRLIKRVRLMVGNHGKKNKDKKRKDFEHADIKHNNK